MERDALLAHGTSFLLQDRLMNCSDYSTSWICRTCGSLISLGFDEDLMDEEDGGGVDLGESSGPNGEYCRLCREDDEERLREGLEPIPKGKKRLAIGGSRMKLPRENLIKRGSNGLDVVAVPYVLKYLAAELASMSLRVSFEIE